MIPSQCFNIVVHYAVIIALSSLTELQFLLLRPCLPLCILYTCFFADVWCRQKHAAAAAASAVCLTTAFSHLAALSDCVKNLNHFLLHCTYHFSCPSQNSSSPLIATVAVLITLGGVPSLLYMPSICFHAQTCRGTPIGYPQYASTQIPCCLLFFLSFLLSCTHYHTYYYSR